MLSHVDTHHRRLAPSNPPPLFCLEWGVVVVVGGGNRALACWILDPVCVGSRPIRLLFPVDYVQCRAQSFLGHAVKMTLGVSLYVEERCHGAHTPCTPPAPRLLLKFDQPEWNHFLRGGFSTSTKGYAASNTFQCKCLIQQHSHEVSVHTVCMNMKSWKLEHTR